MDECSGIRLAIAIAIARSKPPGIPITEHCEQLRARLSTLQTTHPDSPRPVVSRPYAVPQGLESQPTIRALEDRIRDLEASLERSEVEADRAKLALSTHRALHPVTSNGIDEPPPAKNESKKRKEPDSSNSAPEAPRQKGKRRTFEAKSVDNPRISSPSFIQELTLSSISLETLTEHLKNDIPVPLCQSSLGALCSMEVLIRTLESTSCDPTTDTPHISLQSHLRRAISSIATLVTSLLGVTALSPSPCDLKSQSINPPVSLSRSSTTRTKLKICGLALHRVLLLGNCWSLCENNTSSVTDLVVQVSKEIIIPLVNSFHALSCHYAQETFGISLARIGDRSSTSLARDTQPPELIVDLREECAGILVQLLDLHTQPSRPPATAPVTSRHSYSARSDASSEFIPLSGTTAVSDPEAPWEGTRHRADERTANCWFGDIILHICVTEIVRITGTVAEINPQESGRHANEMPRRSGDGARPSLEEVKRIVREETISYLCSLIHAATRARSHTLTTLSTEMQNSFMQRLPPTEDMASSFEIVGRARHMLLDTLLADQRSKSDAAARLPRRGEISGDDGQSASKEDSRRLGILERETIFAAVEALNSCCELPWEEDDGYDTEDAQLYF